MATQTTRPGRTLIIFGAVLLVLLGLVALGGTWKPRLGLDLQGGTRITLQAKTSDGGDITPDKLAEAKTIITQRVNGTGVTASEVSTRGADQIIVEVPGEERSDIVDQVGRTAQLRFRLVWAGPAEGSAQTPPPSTGNGGGAGGTGSGGGDGGGTGNGGGTRWRRVPAAVAATRQEAVTRQEAETGPRTTGRRPGGCSPPTAAPTGPPTGPGADRAARARPTGRPPT